MFGVQRMWSAQSGLTRIEEAKLSGDDWLVCAGCSLWRIRVCYWPVIVEQERVFLGIVFGLVHQYTAIQINHGTCRTAYK